MQLNIQFCQNILMFARDTIIVCRCRQAISILACCMCCSAHSIHSLPDTQMTACTMYMHPTNAGKLHSVVGFIFFFHTPNTTYAAFGFVDYISLFCIRYFGRKSGLSELSAVSDMKFKQKKMRKKSQSHAWK